MAGVCHHGKSGVVGAGICGKPAAVGAGAAVCRRIGGGNGQKEADGGDGHRARHHDIRTCSAVSDIVRKPLAAAGIYACQFHGGGVSAPGRACSAAKGFGRKILHIWNIAQYDTEHDCRDDRSGDGRSGDQCVRYRHCHSD